MSPSFYSDTYSLSARFFPRASFSVEVTRFRGNIVKRANSGCPCIRQRVHVMIVDGGAQGRRCAALCFMITGQRYVQRHPLAL